VIIPCLVLRVLGAVVVWVLVELWQQQQQLLLVQLGRQRQWWQVEKQMVLVVVGVFLWCCWVLVPWGAACC
jgi:hypothetical protein